MLLLYQNVFYQKSPRHHFFIAFVHNFRLLLYCTKSVNRTSQFECNSILKHLILEIKNATGVLKNSNQSKDLMFF